MGRSPMLLPSDLFSRDTFPGTADSSARDRKSTRLNSSHDQISYAVFCLKKKKYANNDELCAHRESPREYDTDLRIDRTRVILRAALNAAWYQARRAYLSKLACICEYAAR